MRRKIIVVACHFEGNCLPCKTTIARLEEALNISDRGDRFLVTGDVPRVIGGPMLGELMQNWLVRCGIPEEKVTILRGGVGTFSEARLACCQLEKNEEIVVVSSPWYFWQGKPIWERRAKESGLRLSFKAIAHTAGWRTVLTYAVLGLIVHTAIFLGFERILEDRLTASQQKRKQGLTYNGCS